MITAAKGTVKANALATIWAKYRWSALLENGENPGFSKSRFLPRSAQIGLGAFALTVPSGETALQVGIVLLSIALVAGSRKIVAGALLLAAVGICLEISTAAGLTIV